ncbi:MAG: mobilization protein [Burkholderiales bacterium]|nr:mobilization protein [Burkholderiales bacterium]
MPRRSIPERLALLETQTLALKARLAKQTRAEDTRRKIVLGGRIEDALATDAALAPALRTWLQDALPTALPRPADRALFADLLPAAPDAATPPEPKPEAARVTGAHP